MRVNRIILTHDGKLALFTKYNEDFVKRMKLVTGRKWNSTTKCWTVPIYNKDELLQYVNLNHDTRDTINKLYDEYMDYTRVDISSLKLADGYKFYKFQEEAIKFCVARGKSMLSLELGLGKTLISLSAARLISNRVPYSGKICITLPKRLISSWEVEINKFYPNVFDYVVIKGNRNEREVLWNESHDVYIFNYDLLNINTDYSHLQRLCEYGTIMIADEVTKIKSWKARRTSRLMRLPSQYRMGLSAIPIENKLEELFTICVWLGNNVFGTFKQFDNRYVLRDSYGAIIDYRNLPEVKQKLKLFMFRKLKSDVLPDLPSIIVENVSVELSLQERTDYSHIERLMRNCISTDGEVLSSSERYNVLAYLTIARLYCGHPLLVFNSNSKTARTVIPYINSNTGTKLEALLDILTSFEDNKVVIFTHFKVMAELIYDTLTKEMRNKHIILVTGGMNDIDARLDEFKTHGDYLISTDVLSYGINMQYCSCLINYDLHLNPVVNKQRVGRLHRIGQNDTVTVINLVVRDHDKIEQWVNHILRVKEDLIQEVLG